MNANVVTGLSWLVGGAGLLYWMTRNGGCGSHSHGSGGRSHEHGGGDASASAHDVQEHPTDPVCGMPVANVTPALQRTYMTRTFSFCLEDCLRKFDADPVKYAGERTSHARRHAHGC